MPHEKDTFERDLQGQEYVDVDMGHWNKLQNQE
jgi:hypothetical protein